MLMKLNMMLVKMTRMNVKLGMTFCHHSKHSSLEINRSKNAKTAVNAPLGINTINKIISNITKKAGLNGRYRTEQNRTEQTFYYRVVTFSYSTNIKKTSISTFMSHPKLRLFDSIILFINISKKHINAFERICQLFSTPKFQL